MNGTRLTACLLPCRWTWNLRITGGFDNFRLQPSGFGVLWSSPGRVYQYILISLPKTARAAPLRSPWPLLFFQSILLTSGEVFLLLTQPLLLLLQLPLGLPGLAMPGTACRPHACVRAFIILLCPKFQGFKPCPASGNGRFPDFADLTPVTGAPPATQKRCEQHGKGQDITKHHCQKQKNS